MRTSNFLISSLTEGLGLMGEWFLPVTRNILGDSVSGTSASHLYYAAVGLLVDSVIG